MLLLNSDEHSLATVSRNVIFSKKFCLVASRVVFVKQMFNYFSTRVTSHRPQHNNRLYAKKKKKIVQYANKYFINVFFSFVFLNCWFAVVKTVQLAHESFRVIVWGINVGTF